MKPEDIFYYLKYKEQLIKKSMNRRYYSEAVTEIEQEIKDCGTDGNTDDGDLLNDTVRTLSELRHYFSNT